MTWRQVTFNNLSLGPVGSATQETLWYGGLHFWLPAHLCQWINQQGFDRAQKPLWGHGDSLLAGVLSAASYFLLVACFMYASLPYRPLGFKQKGPVCECFGRGVGGCEYGRSTCKSAQGFHFVQFPHRLPFPVSSRCIMIVSKDAEQSSQTSVYRTKRKKWFSGCKWAGFGLKFKCLLYAVEFRLVSSTAFDHRHVKMREKPYRL